MKNIQIYFPLIDRLEPTAKIGTRKDLNEYARWIYQCQCKKYISEFATQTKCKNKESITLPHDVLKSRNQRPN